MVEEKRREAVANFEAEAMQDAILLERLRKIRIVNIWTVRIFFTVLFAAAVISFVIPLRPTYSDSEKRELEKFPKFSISALLSGEYFVGIDNWYSDTFPAREFFTDMNTRLTLAFGKNDVVIHGQVEQGDAIPSVNDDAPSEEVSTVSSEEADLESSAVENDGAAQQEADNIVSEESAASSEQTAVVPSDAQSEATEKPAPTVQTLGALLINGDSAYEYYNFVQSAADTYSAAISRAGALLAGKAQVYDIIVPTSMAITAPDDLVAGVNTSNQQDAINYMYSNISEPVKCVPVYDVLKSRRDEYIYFRTDHHWTALGAYYAYCELMNAKGVAPTTLDRYITHEFTGFLGSFYSSSNKLPQLASNPDTVFAYQPRETNYINIQNAQGGWYGHNIISDMSASATANKYITFIRGDNPYSVISNPNITDGSSCIVIKESFGNAFVPFLVAHYQTVYIVDYRYFSVVDQRGLTELCADAGTPDVIFINNVSATRNPVLVGAINDFVR